MSPPKTTPISHPRAFTYLCSSGPCSPWERTHKIAKRGVGGGGMGPREKMLFGRPRAGKGWMCVRPHSHTHTHIHTHPRSGERESGERGQCINNVKPRLSLCLSAPLTRARDPRTWFIMHQKAQKWGFQFLDKRTLALSRLNFEGWRFVTVTPWRMALVGAEIVRSVWVFLGFLFMQYHFGCYSKVNNIIQGNNCGVLNIRMKFPIWKQ
jgi:hypothetical protein